MWDIGFSLSHNLQPPYFEHQFLIHHLSILSVRDIVVKISWNRIRYNKSFIQSSAFTHSEIVSNFVFYHKLSNTTLHETSVKDLLIPARSPQTTLYDVGMVQSIVNQYMMHEKHVRDIELGKNEMGCIGFFPGHGPLLCIGELIDGYLQEIAYDPNLSLAIIDLSQSISELARPVQDGLYKAINIYLHEHPNLTKAERKKICGVTDVKKLTMDASMHAAQNERLPLRVVVPLLFFEQVKAAAGVQSPNSGPRRTSVSNMNPDDCLPLKEETSQVKINEDGELAKKNSKSGMQLLPSRSRRIFNKQWAVGKGHVENTSSQSPTSVVAPGETGSSGFSSRQRRYSIS